ncbi:galactose mutarotase-like domain-containing protein [Sphaerosporella brunnea]|uniref:Galactose mutarotase-like domain-containing protein n=1 Tax=Sphaerosporella brunnea TaxID=1250544 RepID=A0A5J5F337_9PEZI|nr:galactose mutarotase-like domain-containing protein [Sphaerosporella brunnea]
MPAAATFLPTGAILHSLTVGGRNIVLNFNTEDAYISTHNPCHFGATIGRVANRIKDARINELSGAAWELEKNDGKNSLHGGVEGWGKRRWEKIDDDHDDAKAGKETYRLRSGHLEEGFPGEVEVTVAYTVTEKEGKVEVDMEYGARLVGEEVQETVVNVTNHSYFNLSGLPTIEGTEVTLSTNLHLPLDPGGIPVGNSAAPYPGIAANTPFVLGPPGEPDFDDCFVFADAHADPASVPIDTRGLPLRVCGSFFHGSSGVKLEVRSTEPALQFYTGKYVDVPAQEDGTPARLNRAGFCVEPSRFVDAVNREEWRGMVVLRKGEVYGSRIVYSAWVEKKKAVDAVYRRGPG